MLHLPTSELIVFIVAICFYGAAAVVGWIQLTPRGKDYARLLIPLTCMAVCLESIVMVFRAVHIGSIPLTGLFESMLVLTLVLSLVTIFMSLAIPQVWFTSVMAWIIFLLVVLSAVVAEPASAPTRIAVTPWIVFHGLAMVLSSAAIVFSAASSFLFLLSDHRLKQKKVLTVLGRVPNTQLLRRANHAGVLASFAGLTLGLASGVGLAAVQSASLGMSFVDWLSDPKILLIAAAWVLLLLILCLHQWARLSDKRTAYAVLFAFILILFAFVGVAVFGNTVHAFS